MHEDAKVSPSIRLFQFTPTQIIICLPIFATEVDNLTFISCMDDYKLSNLGSWSGQITSGWSVQRLQEHPKKGALQTYALQSTSPGKTLQLTPSHEEASTEIWFKMLQGASTQNSEDPMYPEKARILKLLAFTFCKYPKFLPLSEVAQLHQFSQAAKATT